MLIERVLTRDEFMQLLAEAPESETRFFRSVPDSCRGFLSSAIEETGFVSDRPVYFAALVKMHGRNDLWTVVNSEVKEQFSLYKMAKRRAIDWAKRHGAIHATMHKPSEKGVEWSRRMGFEIVNQDDAYITLRLGG